MNRETLKNYLNGKYQGSQSFMKNVIFPIFGESAFENSYNTNLLVNQPELNTLAESTGIKSVEQVGLMDIGIERLYIFDITVKDRVMMERNRVNIQRLVRRTLDSFSCAFMIFHYEDDSRWDWRFTFYRKGGTNQEVTDGKRYTFLLGPNQSCRTAAENFMRLYDKQGNLEIEDIEKAFDVEALSKEFFEKYKSHYSRFVNYISDPASGMRDSFILTGFDHTGLSEKQITDKEEKPIRDYVKKLLGRIVFLHFLQKKGWMGVPEKGEWGEGDMQFMRNLFLCSTERQKDDFLDLVLEPIFEALDTDRGKNNDLFDTKVALPCGNVVKIPYLNGGLFERDYIDEIDTKFPKEMFAELFEFFYQYNFTIDENDPDDAQVGVDPEMLGRIFENLLEDNKDKGAFYTPKEIVQYMCRESLISYLQTNFGDEQKEAIRQFVIGHDKTSIEGIENQIDALLRDVKICDPAIGSGAFPMGLLRELFFCRSAIEPNIVDNAASIKRHIIQNNIYGVDIEKGAVDIARLRFWLALIVDEKSPDTLPNLDFKIMQGNSLLESYRGADLTTITEKKNSENDQLTFFDDMVDVYRMELRKKISEYYDTSDHSRRSQLRKEIAENVKNQLSEQRIEVDFGDIDLSANEHFFLWHTWFHDVFSRPSKEGFDIVIGNPPYIKEYENRNAFNGFREQSPYYVGKMDLWYGFACHGIDLLTSNGILCFIAQNNWTTSAGAKILRNKVMNDTQIISLIDFHTYMVFEGAGIQTMIMFFLKDTLNSEYTFSIKRMINGAGKSDVLNVLNGNESAHCEHLNPLVIRASLNNKLFTFSPNDSLLDKIAKDCYYLQESEATNGIHPHFDFVNNKINRANPWAKVGDGIFALSNSELLNLELSKEERKLIKPYYDSTEVLRYYTIQYNHQWIIYTGSSFRDARSMDSYPRLKAHLDVYRDIITSDNKPYGLHRAREEKFFKGEKIVAFRKCVERPCFSYSDFDCYVSATFYVIKTSRFDMKFLTGLLNSKLVAFWLRNRGKMQGANYQIDKEPLLQIPIKSDKGELVNKIADLVSNIISLKKTTSLTDTSSYESEIDELVYSLYNITPEEREIIEIS